MNVKNTWQFLKSKFFWSNILLAIVILVLVVAVTLVWLRQFTHHGEGVEVPNLSGMYVEEAELLLKEQHLGYEVIDSVYLKRVNPGEITEQSPSKGTKVKKNRKVYLTINAKGSRMIPVPELRNISYRQARITLTNMGFKVGEIEYRPSEFADLVMDIKLNDAPVVAGTKLSEGTELIMVVGTTESDQEVVIPKFQGITLQEARELAVNNDVIVGTLNYDVEPQNETEKALYYVYDQEPQYGELHRAGKRVNLWLSKDKNHKPKPKRSDDEDFFN